jgi:hypothetical protein
VAQAEPDHVRAPRARRQVPDHLIDHRNLLEQRQGTRAHRLDVLLAAVESRHRLGHACGDGQDARRIAVSDLHAELAALPHRDGSDVRRIGIEDVTAERPPVTVEQLVAARLDAAAG